MSFISSFAMNNSSWAFAAKFSNQNTNQNNISSYSTSNSATNNNQMKGYGLIFAGMDLLDDGQINGSSLKKLLGCPPQPQPKPQPQPQPNLMQQMMLMFQQIMKMFQQMMSMLLGQNKPQNSFPQTQAFASAGTNNIPCFSQNNNNSAIALASNKPIQQQCSYNPNNSFAAAGASPNSATAVASSSPLLNNVSQNGIKSKFITDLEDSTKMIKNAKSPQQKGTYYKNALNAINEARQKLGIKKSDSYGVTPTSDNAKLIHQITSGENVTRRGYVATSQISGNKGQLSLVLNALETRINKAAQGLI